MAQRGQKDLLTRLADAGEEAIQRLAGTPGAERVLHVVTNLRDQVDALQKRMRGLEELERRLDALERRVNAMSKTPARTTRARTTARKTTAKTTASRTTGTTRSRKRGT